MKAEKKTILVIEDDPSDQDFIVRAFRSVGVTGPIHVLDNGIEAIRYLNGDGEYSDRKKYEFPTTIITDLKMPLLDGFGVLHHLKSHPQWAVIPTIVLSGSADEDDIKKAYLLGASSFFMKPHGYGELKALIKRLYEYWREAEMPRVDLSGEMLKTQGKGKLAERFGESVQ